MIDAHHHFWKYNKKDFKWIDDSMSSIRKDFLPEDLSPILQENGVDGSVLVQVNRNESENNEFLNHAESNDFIKGTVGWINLADPQLEKNLEKYEMHSKLKGFREIAQGQAHNYFPVPDFRKGVKTLSQKGYTYDILINENDLKETLHFVRALPNCKMVIDHIAKPNIKEKSIKHWANYMKAIAQHPNIYVKVSGMTTEADWEGWSKEDFYIYLDHILMNFGPNRIMYGSDWPVCLVAASYAEQLDILKSYTDKMSSADQHAIFHQTAVEFYGLGN